MMRQATSPGGGLLFALLAAMVSACAVRAEDAPAPPKAGAVQFSRDVLPILSDNCFKCHGPDEKARKAKLRLDVKEGAFRVKDGVAVIVPGKPGQSELIKRITSKDPDEMMPPPDSNRKLTAHQIELLTRWVEEGAAWGQHWAFVKPVRPAVPVVKEKGWVRNPIDAFVLERLEKEGIEHSPEASKETLIRRVTLDLTGLPPTPGEVDAFLADSSPDAYEKVVDQLLASPRYGERMVWAWLDAARYADTNGYQGDNTRTMWPWRDWAVKAMNENMRFDRFTVWQIAGDLLPNATAEQKIATGFCRNHMINGEGGRIPEENRVDYVMDQTETVGTVWMGVTIGCCRCHDHKFDPFLQKEYYELFAFFNNTPVTGAGGNGQTAPVVDMATPEQKAKQVEYQRAVKKVAVEVDVMERELFPRGPKELPAVSPKAAGLSGNIIADLKKATERRSPDGLREMVNYFKEREPAYSESLAKLRHAIEERDAFNASMARVMVMEEMPKPRDTFVLVKGAYDKLAEKVEPGIPRIFEQSASGVEASKRRLNRLDLAKWLVSPENPLTARVTVNRYWQQFFGVGIVKTVEDFGIQGERPVNPQLLDWLATEFVNSGWDVKAMHRLIVTSAAYRQSSKVTAEMAERDPENRLLARGPRFRLPAFMIRDQALAASGLLVEKLGGPPVKPYQPAGIWEEATFGKVAYKQDHGCALYRRSLYTFWRRIVGPTEFFDSAARQTCTVRATRTNTPLQALTLLDDTTFVEAARALAQRVMLEGGSTAESRIEQAFRLVLARRPTDQERSVLLASLERLKAEYAADPAAAAKLLSVGESKRDDRLDPIEHTAYTGVCTAIFNLDEAVTKE